MDEATKNVVLVVCNMAIAAALLTFMGWSVGLRRREYRLLEENCRVQREMADDHRRMTDEGEDWRRDRDDRDHA